MKCNKIFLLIPFILLSTCGTTSYQKYDVLKYSAKSQDNLNIEKYLVKIDQYTTNGSLYHKKYKRYLFGAARILDEEKKVKIVENSIGFYFDKKEDNKNRLYLGVDIFADQEKVELSSSYVQNGRAVMKYYLENILEVLYSCVEVLEEKDVKGMVIGLHWKVTSPRFINVWISKKDVKRFYDKNLTFRQLVFRSTVTNHNGQIIRLTL